MGRTADQMAAAEGEMNGMVAGPLFQDYLGMLDANTAIVRGPIDINASDCLIVIDMQNDFVSAASDNPVESPPFASTESLHIVQPICEMMKRFHKAGGMVLATKDYHPWDHCSFEGHSAKGDWPGDPKNGPPNFPSHCVQGSEGADFYAPICATLCDLMRADPARAKVAWKGFHEEVDSFGGVIYPEDTEGVGRFPATYGKAPCQMSAWTGSFILQSSMMCGDNGTFWHGQLDPQHVDAPPDVMAVETKEAVHDYMSAKGCKRVFVCGLVLDVCVVDTCLNVKKAMPDCEVFMVLDSSRPAHINGVGFLNEAPPVGEWIKTRQLALALTMDILDETTMQQLAHRDVPVVGLCSPAENIPGFPENLSLRLVRCPQLRMALETVLMPTDSTCGEYCTKKLHTDQMVTRLGLVSKGKLSPVHEVTLEHAIERRQSDIPSGAVSFAYAYPIEGSNGILDLVKQQGQTPTIFQDANVAFVFFGGFVYFDDANKVCGCTGRVTAGSQSDALTFKNKADFADAELLEKLSARMAPTGPSEASAGATSMAWVLPGEGPPENNKGGFVFNMANGDVKWYFL